jgi:integrase
MSRNGKGEGTIYKRADGRWLAQFTHSGKRLSFYGKTRKEALARREEARRAVERGLPLPGAGQSVAQYLTSWLEMSRLTIRATSRSCYANDVKRLCTAPFAALPLVNLTSQQVQEFYADQLKELSSTSVRHLHSVLHHALADAWKHSLVPENVTIKVDTPRRAYFEMQPLSEAQAQQLLSAAPGERLEALFVLALKTGMRRGELLALRWADVDLARGSVSVRTSAKVLSPSIREGAARKVLSETKNGTPRPVPLSPLTVEALRAHQHRQKLERMEAAEWSEHDLVFPGYHGDILEPEAPGIVLKRLLKSAGLPAIRFHDLRHTAVTLLLAHGIDHKTVAERVGDDVVTLLRVYAHVSTTQRERAAAMIDAIFETPAPEHFADTQRNRSKTQADAT